MKVVLLEENGPLPLDTAINHRKKTRTCTKVLPHKQLSFEPTPSRLASMKLHLALCLASLFSLSSGFMAELRGPLTDEACSGEEYADFEECVMVATEADSNLPSKLTGALEGKLS
jgi:hypothetical protein